MFKKYEMSGKSILKTYTKTKNLVSVKTNDAPTIWSSLNGIINIFKPAGTSLHHVRNAIATNICKGFDGYLNFGIYQLQYINLE